MATIAILMSYLEQGYSAFDPFRRAYLRPFTKDGVLQFEWTAYEGEGDWSGPDIHSKEYVLTWRSSDWGIETFNGGSLDRPEEIERAIANGNVCKADASMAGDNPRLAAEPGNDAIGKDQFTFREAADYLKMSMVTFTSLVETKRIQPTRVGRDGTRFYGKNYLDQWKKENL